MKKNEELIQASPGGRFLCYACGQRFDFLGNCPRRQCQGEPLMDLSDEGVRQLIADFDDKAALKRLGRLTMLAILMTLPAYALGIILFLNVPDFPIEVALTPILLTIAAERYLSKRFPKEPRLPDLTDKEFDRLADEPS